MFSCFLCKDTSMQLNDYIRHLRKRHALYEGETLELKCTNTNCSKSYKTFCGFKKHIQKCIENIVTSVTPDAIIEPANIERISIPDFSKSIKYNEKKAANDYLCSYISKLYSLNLPETTIQVILESTDELLAYVKAHSCKEELRLLNSENFSTKFRRTQYLKNKIVLPKEVVIGIRYDKKWNKTINSYIQVPIPCKFSYVSILDTLSFIADNDSALFLMKQSREKSSLIVEFSDGLCFGRNPLFKENIFSFQIQLYYDEFETVNPLGSKTGGHKIGAFYMIIKNIPSEFNSVIQNIHLVALFYSNDIKEFGFNKILDVIVSDLKILEENGVFVKKIGCTVKGTLVAISHDNLGGNQLFGMVESFSANYFCRICLVDKQTSKILCTENEALLRTNELYENHCYLLDSNLSRNFNSYGIKFRSSLNNLRYFKLCENPSVDIMHDMLEGTIQLELKLFLKFLVSENLITIESFNSRLKSFDFGLNNSSNQPSPILLDKAGNSIGQRAAQSWCLIKFFPLIIYDLVTAFNVEQFEKFEVILLLIEITSIVFNPICSPGLATKLETLIETHHKFFTSRMNHNLIPKHHMMTHYPGVMRKMGPLVGLWSMRFEAKHAYFKNLVHSLKNFKTVCKTLALRHQTHMWNHWKNIDLSLRPIFGKCYLKNIQNESYAQDLRIILNVSLNHIKFTSMIRFSGCAFRIGNFITNRIDIHLCPIFSKIFAICVHNSDVIFVCEPWITKCFDTKSQTYIVEPITYDRKYEVIALKTISHKVSYDLSSPYLNNFKCIVPKYDIVLK